jgi:hypothetical protein
MATCYSRYDEVILNDFVTMIKASGRLSRSMASNLNRLTGKQYSVQTVRSIQEKGLLPVTPGHFQVLTKSETVHQYKEIILEDKASGDMYTGAEVRVYLGLFPQVAKGGAKEKLPATGGNYVVYVQSTSVNRKLIGGTRFLYEVQDI